MPTKNTKASTAKSTTTKKTGVKTADKPAQKTGSVKTTAESKAVDKSKTADKPVENKLNAQTVVSVKKSERKRILYVCSEAFPFAGTGGLGEVMGSLPRAINDSGEYEARVILPLYGSFPQSRRGDLQFMFWTFVRLSWRNQYCGVYRLQEGNTVFYFIDNEYYYKRDRLYGYYDDAERFAFFSKAVVDILPRLDFMPNVLHCNDWQTALVPVYYKLYYMYNDGYGGIKTVFTIHNIEYQGSYDRFLLQDVFGIDDREFGSLDHFGSVNLMKGAIEYSDAVTTVSPTYAYEITDPYYAHTLDGTLRKNKFKLRGILNGVDTVSYNPETNPALKAHFSADDKRGKAVDKADLQSSLGLPERANTPLIAMITRLATHKGLDIVRDAMERLLSRDVQMVVLGAGDSDYENYFRYMQQAHGDKFRAVIAFDKALSHRIYAGADIFLMPSKSEPCGLSQMMACRYGTIPVVRETGGLKDSITDAYNGDFGNGYKFSRYDADDMLGAIDRAVGLYRDYHDKWDGLVDRAMRTDFSWGVSASEYVRFYDEII